MSDPRTDAREASTSTEASVGLSASRAEDKKGAERRNSYAGLVVLLIGVVVIVSLVFVFVSYLWSLFGGDTTIRISGNFAGYRAMDPDPPQLSISGTFDDQMIEGDSQLIALELQSANLATHEAATLMLRVVGPGVLVEPESGYEIPVPSGSTNGVYRFSLSPQSGGGKVAIVFARVTPSRLSPEFAPTMTVDNAAIQIDVAQATTLGLGRDTWAVLGTIGVLLGAIVTLLRFGTDVFSPTRAGRRPPPRLAGVVETTTKKDPAAEVISPTDT